jgi:uncharacterized protein YvpB/subtilisin-like proprotein convertase family protein
MKKHFLHGLLVLTLNGGLLLLLSMPQGSAFSQVQDDVRTDAPATAPPLAVNPAPSPVGTTALNALAQDETNPEKFLFLPLIEQPPKTSEVLYCNYPNTAIPENGIAVDTLTLSEPDYIISAEIWAKIDHSYVGDVSISLVHEGSQQEISLLDRPGYPATGTGCAYDNIYAIFSDSVSQPAEGKCRAAAQAIAGMYLPVEPLGVLAGHSAAGNWTLRVKDAGEFDTGELGGWCLYARLSSHPPRETVKPTLPALPVSASVYGVYGQSQALPLDCESRSAVDWAAFFGKSIYELSFFNKLPISDNPNKGFVGSVYGVWGQVPPADYGIHAEPVAALLRAYGLPAQADIGLRWDDVRAEIAEGQPVIVWVEGYIRAGKSRFYRSPSDGAVSIVAPYEHTVIVVGYNANYVSILNGGDVSSVPLNSFLDAWATLGNMAIRYR